jgi:hypothetical protein
MFDPSIDKMSFMDIARTISLPLADRSYLPTADPKTTKLLLVVYWGTTYAPENSSESPAYAMGQQKAKEERASYQDLKDALHEPGTLKDLGQSSPNDTAWVKEARLTNAQNADAESAALGVMQAQNKTRDQLNKRNASMLGYDSEWNEIMGGLSGPIQEVRKSQMISELEEQRYFVVVMAYDYQLLVRSKAHKLLWETRFSIRQHGQAFNQQLKAMVVEASAYFGEDSNGLRRKTLPEGQVDIGAVRNLGVVAPEAAKVPAPQSTK